MTFSRTISALFASRLNTVLMAACKEVGLALLFSLLIITVSFLPVFTLEL